MSEELRYLMVEEREEYNRLAKEYGIKGYSPQITMIYPSQSILQRDTMPPKGKGDRQGSDPGRKGL